MRRSSARVQPAKSGNRASASICSRPSRCARWLLRRCCCRPCSMSLLLPFMTGAHDAGARLQNGGAPVAKVLEGRSGPAYAGPVELLLLGPLEMIGPAGPVTLRGPKERSLLALLATRANEVVSTAALIDGLWGEDPP